MVLLIVSILTLLSLDRNFLHIFSFVEGKMSDGEREIIYIVIEGSYNDYFIVGVFSDKVVAEKCAESRHNTALYVGGARVEEYYLNSGPIPQRIWYEVTIDTQGEEVGRREYSEEINQPGIDKEDPKIWELWAYGGWRGISAGSYRGYNVALKVAHDKLAEIKARKAGVA
jgi:hypothetical protein